MKKVYLIDFIGFMIAKAKNISHLFSMAYVNSGNRWQDRDVRQFRAVSVGSARRALRHDGAGEERGRQRGLGPPHAERPRLLRQPDAARPGSRTGRLPGEETRNLSSRRSQRCPYLA